jgi:hypothetical protein
MSDDDDAPGHSARTEPPAHHHSAYVEPPALSDDEEKVPPAMEGIDLELERLFIDVDTILHMSDHAEHPGRARRAEAPLDAEPEPRPPLEAYAGYAVYAEDDVSPYAQPYSPPDHEPEAGAEPGAELLATPSPEAEFAAGIAAGFEVSHTHNIAAGEGVAFGAHAERARYPVDVEAVWQASHNALVALPLRRYTAIDTEARAPGCDDGVVCAPWREQLRAREASVSTSAGAIGDWLSNPASVPPMPQTGVDMLGCTANDAMSRVLARVNRIFSRSMLSARDARHPRPVFADCAFHVVQSLVAEIEAETAPPRQQAYSLAIEFELVAAIDLFNATCAAPVPDVLSIGSGAVQLRPARLHPLDAYRLLSSADRTGWSASNTAFHAYITTNTRRDIRVILRRAEELVRNNQRVLLVDGTRHGTLTKMMLPFETVPDLEPHIARHTAEHQHTNTVEGAWRELWLMRLKPKLAVRSIACVSILDTDSGGALLLMRSDGSGLEHNTHEFTRVSRTFGFRIRAAGLAHQTHTTILVTEASHPVVAHALVQIADTVFAFEHTRAQDAAFIARVREQRHDQHPRTVDAVDVLGYAFPCNAQRDHFEM